MVTVGPIVSLITSLTPLVEVNDIVSHNRSTNESTCLVYASMWLSYALWSVHNFLKADYFPVGLINFWGLFICSFYCFVFIEHVDRRSKMRVQITYVITLVCALITIYYCMKSVHPIEIVISRVESLASLMSVLMMGAPLTSILQVLQRGTDTISFPLSVMYNITAAYWCYHGIVTDNSYIALTNLIGGLLCLIELALFAFLPSSNHSNLA
mmetsp:Transcript_17881/g.17952  ORF Transcript_17881/g.17952 Transcript_17881/m.17952 type:complete len:211 (-) Transcript_17881:270-902(-)